MKGSILSTLARCLTEYATVGCSKLKREMRMTKKSFFAEVKGGRGGGGEGGGKNLPLLSITEPAGIVLLPLYVSMFFDEIS